MNRSIIIAAAVALALVSFSAEAKKKKTDAAEIEIPKGTPMKAGVHQKCLQARADAGTEWDAWIHLGQLDQVRGDGKSAMEKYRKAVALGADVSTAKIDFTLVNDVIWIQTDACPVPVPGSVGLGEAVTEGAMKEVTVKYPPILRFVLSEGSVTPRVWIGTDGKPTRISIVEVTSSLPEAVHTRQMYDERAERFYARVQFAMQTIETLRAHEFTGAEGKVWEQRLVYKVPDEMKKNVPGQHVDSSAPAPRGPGGL